MAASTYRTTSSILNRPKSKTTNVSSYSRPKGISGLLNTCSECASRLALSPTYLLNLFPLKVHVGAEPDEATNAVIQSISLSTTFKQDAVGVHKVRSYVAPDSSFCLVSFSQRGMNTVAQETRIETPSRNSLPPWKQVDRRPLLSALALLLLPLSYKALAPTLISSASATSMEELSAT